MLRRGWDGVRRGGILERRCVGGGIWGGLANGGDRRGFSPVFCGFQDSIAQYREHLAAIEKDAAEKGEGGEEGRDESDASAELNALSEILLLPIASLLPSSTPLCVIGHAELHLVPFAALPLPSGEPLGIAHPLHYAPSLTTLLLLLQREEAAGDRREGAGVLLVGSPSPSLGEELNLPPIPSSGEEVELVGSLVHAAPEEVMVGGEAKLSGVLDALSSPLRLIHIAAHSCAKWVAMAADDEGGEGEVGEGKDEAMLLNDQLHLIWLGAHPTVVLSGSRCGYGEVSEDWLLGLPRTFLIAGARSVVSCLWDADDEATKALMGCFYSQLSAHPRMTQAEALRLAMVEVRGRGEGEWAHPLFWAGFTLTGISKGI